MRALSSILLLALTLLPACGASSNDTGAVSTGGSGGAAGSESGTSGAAGVATSSGPRGAYSIHLTQSHAPEELVGCLAYSNDESAGTVDGMHVVPSDHATMSCSITASDASIAFTGEIDVSTTRFKIEGTLLPDHTGTARVAVMVPEAPGLVLTAPTTSPCTVSTDPALGPSLSASATTIWAAVSCPVLSDPSYDPGVADCALEPDGLDAGAVPGGYFYVTGCE